MSIKLIVRKVLAINNIVHLTKKKRNDESAQLSTARPNSLIEPVTVLFLYPIPMTRSPSNNNFLTGSS